jgi:hypothetical protein
MTSRAAALAAAALAIVAAGCHRPAPDAPPPSEEATVAAVEEAAASDAAALVAARCRRSEKVLRLDAVGGGRVAADGGTPGGGGDLEIGDAVGYAGGVAVGLIHHTAAGRTAAVALLRADPSVGAHVVDLGPTLGDAPPPRLGRRNGDLVAVAYALTSAPAGAPAADAAAAQATRGAAVYTIAADAVAGSPLAVPQRRDESFALDVAFAGSNGLLVWDEATSAPRGVVRAAAFARDHAEPTRDVSPVDSDAELPRVVASGAGFVVTWIARRPEATSLPEAAPAEATGEARTYGWLEAIAVDAHGAVTGPARRLTSSAGHISAYDVVAVPLAVPGDTTPPALLVVVARDDGEAVDGSGGALLRVRMRGEAIEPAEPIVTDGLGRGAPTLVAWPAAEASAQPAPVWVSWAGKDEQARLLPLSSTGAVTERPSAEDALDEGQPLLFLEPGPGVGAGIGTRVGTAIGPGVRPAVAPGIGAGVAPEAEVLVAAPSDPAGPLLLFACAQGANH